MELQSEKKVKQLVLSHLRLDTEMQKIENEYDTLYDEADKRIVTLNE